MEVGTLIFPAIPWRSPKFIFGLQLQSLQGPAEEQTLNCCCRSHGKWTIADAVTNRKLVGSDSKITVTMGLTMITHMFIVWELLSQLHRTSVTQRFLAGIALCHSAPS